MKSIDDYAMRYEIIIRKAYNCERYGCKSADADIYRKLLADYLTMINSKNLDFEKNRELFQKQCQMVSNYLTEAAQKLKIYNLQEQNTIHGINVLIDNILQ